MDIETQLLKEYKEYMIDKTTFKDLIKILPSTPQSFSIYPTIVFSEVTNVDFVSGKTLDRIETVDSLAYQIDIYTKDIKLDDTTYSARTIVNELKDLTFKFFNDAGFIRLNATRGEYIDVTVLRYTILFSGKLNNWNMKISQ